MKETKKKNKRAVSKPVPPVVPQMQPPKQMTKGDAIQVVQQACDAFVGNKQAHVALQIAMDVLRQPACPVPPGKKS